MSQAGTYFQKGLGLKAEVAPELARSYASGIVDRIKEFGYAVRVGDIELLLAREFGFCYGVERAVEYAYQTRARFPERQLFLSGEIIHNDEVNARLERLGVRILPHYADPEARYEPVRSEDVMILPAFGVTAPELAHLRSKGCILVDTTCGSVMNVWKNVRRYARDGFTSVIHGKHYHEETRATASQTRGDSGSGHYLCVRDLEEAGVVCDFIRGELSSATLSDRFEAATSDGFDPDRHLEKIGLANQTTMLMSESVAIQALLRDAMRDRYGEHGLAEHFFALDTICSATQDRQDAVAQMLVNGKLDVMLVIGGFNSSNTIALTRTCAERLPTYHISGPECLEGGSVRHKPLGAAEPVRSTRWLPEGPTAVGLTAGASTPNNVVGNVVENVLAIRGLRAQDITARPA